MVLYVNENLISSLARKPDWDPDWDPDIYKARYSLAVT
jgi:hypothetical protein